MATKKTAKKAAKKAAPAKKAAAKKGGATAKKATAKKGGATAKKGGATAAKKAPAMKKAAAKTGGATAKKAAGSGKKRALNPALLAPMRPSGELAAVIGEQPRPRSEVAKSIWNYIHKHGLQDQTNKRNINADDNLRKVFGGKKQVSMFEMTALVSKHLSKA
jgi:chromatin remodeling complex protein RSC6